MCFFAMVSANGRGERLLPKPSSRVYWHLECLRKEFQGAAELFVKGRNYGALIDYGCGNMPYRPIFAPHVTRYLGCDFHGNDLAEAQLTAKGELPCERGSADVVLSSQVLEHCESPSGYLRKCRRVLRDNGLLILSTHGVWRYHRDPHDFWRWTSEGLRMQIEGQGFDVLQFRGVMGPAATALQLWQDATLPRVYRRFQKPFVRLMQFLYPSCRFAMPDRGA